MKIFLPSLLISSLFLASCGGNKGADRANALCDCVKGSVDLKNLDVTNPEKSMRDVSKENQKKTATCVVSVAEGLAADMKDMNKEDKKAYTKVFMKGLVDCDCMDMILDKVPFDLINTAVPAMKKEVEREFDRKSEPAAGSF